MKFSAQEEYGLRCLVAIAREGSLTIPELSTIEGLSQPHVAKLLSILRKGEFLNSTRGQSGGYALSRPPDQIVVGEVLTSLGGRLYEPDFCDKHAGVQDECTHAIACSLRELWSRVQTAVDQVVYQVTLKELMEPKENPGEWVVLQKMPKRGAYEMSEHPKKKSDMPESDLETGFPVAVAPDAIVQMKRLLARKGSPGTMVRIGVKGGGCSGLEYVLALEENKRPDDFEATFEDVTILCDPKSAPFIRGSTLEYSSNLMSGGFQFNNPNAKRSCGCGTSFTPADQE